MIRSFYNICQNFYLRVYTRISHFLTLIYFSIQDVNHGPFVSIGIPVLSIDVKSTCELGSDLIMVNKAKYSMLNKTNRCKLAVSSGGKLVIGNKVGMSNVTIIATSSISIGSNILIGGGVTIVDTDFHSLNPSHWHTDEDNKNMRSSPVVIGDHVFIGMDSIILKGVTIGEHVIIGAGSVVSKDIPAYQIWGGNPARFIKNNKI